MLQAQKIGCNRFCQIEINLLASTMAALVPRQAERLNMEHPCLREIGAREMQGMEPRWKPKAVSERSRESGLVGVTIKTSKKMEL